MGGDRRPAFQFYPADWSTDIDLQRCSLAAQGLWIDMLCLMHHGEPYGHLQTGSGVINTRELASLVGATVKEVSKCLGELKRWDVCSVTESGTIYSRRMVLDAKDHSAFRQRQAAAGRASGAARRLKVAETKQDLEPDAKPETKSPPSERSQIWGLNQFLDLWNDTADKCALSKIKVMSDSRIRVLRRRINEHGEEEVRRALHAPRRSKYLCGQLPAKPWKVTFDWLMKQTNMLKVLENNYDDKGLPPIRTAEEVAEEKGKKELMKNITEYRAALLEVDLQPEGAKIAKDHSRLLAKLVRNGSSKATICGQFFEMHDAFVLAMNETLPEGERQEIAREVAKAEKRGVKGSALRRRMVQLLLGLPDPMDFALDEECDS